MRLNDVTPMLQARSLEETVDFYTQSLGFSLEGTWPAEGPKSGARYAPAGLL